MAIAIISDIHSNLEALEEVLKDIKAHGATKIYCLGDLVGYGPDPKRVVEYALDWDMVVQGNHDAAVLWEIFGFNPAAHEAIEYTRKQLRPSLFSAGAYRFLSSLPMLYKENDVLFVHGSPRDPLMEYILKHDCKDLLGGRTPKLTDIFSRVERLCFVGHSHDPGIITEEGDYLSPSSVDYIYKLDPRSKYIINAGSVGQPRDGDPRACYILFDGDVVTWRRLEYDRKKTMEKIMNTTGLQKRLAERLGIGR